MSAVGMALRRTPWAEGADNTPLRTPKHREVFSIACGRDVRLDSWGNQMFLISMNISRTKLVGMALVIFAATIWLYWPSVHGQFLTRMDDEEYLRQLMQWNGLTWHAVKWTFTSTDPYYHPLPRLSHVLDYQMWGKNAAGHHATTVILHALNAVPCAIVVRHENMWAWL